MNTLFNTAPDGIQAAPFGARALADQQQVTAYEVDLSQVQDKTGLMAALLTGLRLKPTFGRNWDALYDVLTDPAELPDRAAIVLRQHLQFRQHHAQLCEQLESVLLDAQAESKAQGRELWLLTEQRDPEPS